MHAFSEGKILSEPEPRRLQDIGEGIGQLIRVMILEDMTVAVFPWGSITVPIELEARLRELLGKKIGILRLDGKFHIREVK